MIGNYAEVMDAEFAEILVLGVFHLPIHPDVEWIAVIIQHAIGCTVIFTLTRHHNFRKSFQQTGGRGDDRPDGQSSPGQFFLRHGFIVVVHEIDVSFERHSRFENSCFCASETEFELGADDARFDESVASFAFEMMVQRHGDSDHPTDQAANTDAAPHFFQLDVVREIMGLIFIIKAYPLN